jgi:hypothetical protein
VHYCVTLTRVFFSSGTNKTLRKHADIWPCGERRALIKLAPSARQVLTLSRALPANNNRFAISAAPKLLMRFQLLREVILLDKSKSSTAKSMKENRVDVFFPA